MYTYTCRAVTAPKEPGTTHRLFESTRALETDSISVLVIRVVEI